MKDTLKAFDGFKNNQKGVWSNVFLIYVYSESAFNTLQIEIKHTCWKISFVQSKRYKKYPLSSFASFNSSQLYFYITTLIWVEEQGSLKMCVEFSILDSVSFLLKSICSVLRDLVLFVQFKKREKHQWRIVSFSKFACFSLLTLLKLILLHGCFSRFLNCKNGTKSRNAPHILVQ